MRHESERIIIDLPVGSGPRHAMVAAMVAYRFATEQLDRPTGQRHYVAYRDTDCDVIAWWTARRAVSVRVVRREEA
jgi:hypothetical protein